MSEKLSAEDRASAIKNGVIYMNQGGYQSLWDHAVAQFRAAEAQARREERERVWELVTGILKIVDPGFVPGALISCRDEDCRE